MQVTKSATADELVVTPFKKAGIVTVTVESKIHKETITINVKELQVEEEFKLEKTSLVTKTSSIDRIKITNWDNISEEKRPDTLNFDNDGYATARIDTANKEIVVETFEKNIDNLKLSLISKDGNQTTVVSIKIETALFDLEQEDLVVNIAAGNMTNGTIDPTIAVGSKGFEITNEAIINGFNTMNGINISADELIIERESDGNNGIGALVNLRAKEGSTVVKGEVSLTLNQNIDPNDYFANKNLGEIRLFKGAYNKLDEVLNSSDAISLGAIVFEQVGAKNTQLEYVKANFIQNLGAAGKEIMKNAVTTATTFQITNMPTLKGIFKENINVEFTYKFVEEDRITLFEALPETKRLNVNFDDLENKAKFAQKEAKTYIYNQLSEEFKNKISLTHFIEFTNLIFNTKDEIGNDVYVKLDVLPGSDLLYGHDGAAFIGYINNPGGLAGASGGGNLEKYEDSKKLDDKYTTGMGYFDTIAAMGGNFYQGHAILDVTGTNYIENMEIHVNEEKSINFGNIETNSEIVLEVNSSNNKLLTINNFEKNEIGDYIISIKGLKVPGLFASQPIISIKVNGKLYRSFTVKVLAANK